MPSKGLLAFRIISRFDWKGSDNVQSAEFHSGCIISRFDWKGSDNSRAPFSILLAIISRFDWKGSDNCVPVQFQAKLIISRFDWKGSDNSKWVDPYDRIANGIETARASARGGPSDFAAKFSLDC